jgi:hypothetical protein
MNKKKYLSKLNTQKKHKNFLRFYCDFETVVYKSQHYVTCYSIVDKDKTYSNVVQIKQFEKLSEFSNLLITEFLNKCFELVKCSNYKNSTCLFFFHNLNKFDSYFILNTISNLENYDIKLITRNNQVYKITIVDIKNHIKLEFRDSLLYLPIPLDTISEVFCLKYKKLVFDQTQNIIENYIKEETFLIELKNYCIHDSLCLQEGFEHFLNYIRMNLNIEPLESLSLPGISLKYFRSKFYDDEKLPIERLSENKDHFIRKSYRGGIVELFKPHLLDGYHYDVNSLYPYVMKSFPMPIGVGEWVDIDDIENFFGFIKVEVTSPTYLHKPFLSYYNEKLGLISPVGKWTEIYFSEEIKYALTLGYKFKYIKGLSYKKGILFDKFVDSLYSIRLNHSKGTPLNLIIKLLLNSIYGRFGMKTDMLKSKLVPNSDVEKYVSIYDVTNISTFNVKSLINFKETPVLEKLNLLLTSGIINIEEYNNLKKNNPSINENSAVQIASAITSYARIFMDKFKRDENLDVYYSDTDSIFSKNPLSYEYISDITMGNFKLENRIKEAIFILPKFYMLKTFDNKEIIKCKGISKELLTEEDIRKAFNNSEGIFKKLVSYFVRDFKHLNIIKQDRNIFISPTLLKRKKIYKDGKWVDTTPLKI